MIELADDIIDLWFVFPNDIWDRSLLDAYQQLLTSEERKQQQRFHFEQDRHRYLLTRALVRTTLSNYLTTRPEDWRFVANRYGRPEIASDDELEKSIVFNISHTNDVILCGVTKHHALGVDVESFCSRKAPLNIARNFSPREWAALCKVDADAQAEQFACFWALKESYLKALGMGLSLSLTECSFDFSGEGLIRVSFESGVENGGREWCFWLFAPTEHHRVAICAEHHHAGTQQLVMRRVVPMQSCKPFPDSILKQSRAN